MPVFGGGGAHAARQAAMAAVGRDTNNFKVVVRVRPPLKRELPPKGEKDEDGLSVKFKSVAEISLDNR